ncbi:TonB-dependent receptor [Cellulophaga algicola DSM 14237]|uniref:TonB-dependent receptor n=1 Tax=Cellulophaga algicola (strain DSM 14237 / IC166 / ACAM 630) TaxID=688270 RepID=E6X455_CELAD|nr:carboxypeptidase-like regulatory domain-containing protein [Cellulophaga algicola]ADV50397.1 TonB-dependent receptor [Cellulophaga algicola DSM 14237]
MKAIFLFIVFLSIQPIYSQLKITGIVLERTEKGDQISLEDVHITWAETTIGTLSNKDGEFSLAYTATHTKLVFSYVGYVSDTITVNRPHLGKIYLQPNIALEEVVVKRKINSIQKSLFNPQNTVNVDSREMLKAACCNLSESFETNPSVDVSISDGISGAKQIQMLGMNSPYLLFTQENMPFIRGASQIYGLSFIPGSWIESIQITKGAGAVLNGFESISGQINTELVKPLTDQKFFFNSYANSNERFELNTRYNTILNDKLATGLYLHTNLRSGKIDRNNDNFLDTPLAKQLNLMNRWQYIDLDKGWVSYLNLQYLTDKKQTGDTRYEPRTDKFTSNIWGSEINTHRFDASAKIGYVFPDLQYQSFGYQTAYSDHRQNSYYGNTIYTIDHQSFYSNLLFNSIIGSTQHKFKTGLSFNYDKYDEEVTLEYFSRVDNAIGSFFEYTYDSLEKLSFVAGLRADHSNRLGNFMTPRLHVRYSLWDKASLRFNLGRGKRAANIYAENQQLFASNRTITILSTQGKIYGLDPEIAWNTGLNFTQKGYLFNRLFDISLDYYHVSFIDQVVVDWETPQEISFYNLKGKSISNSVQMDFNYEILKNLDIRATYKNYDVHVNYNKGRLEKPLQPRNRVFINLNYETKKKYEGRQWVLDFTANRLGKQRLPDTSANPAPYQLDTYAAAYTILNTQITRIFNNSFDIYMGGENIGNFVQKQPIIAASDPFGPYFDSTITYAPTLGGTYYLGLRYKIK